MYFTPSRIDQDKDRTLFLIDGGTVANNPSVCAFADVVKQGIDAEQITWSPSAPVLSPWTTRPADDVRR